MIEAAALKVIVEGSPLQLVRGCSHVSLLTMPYLKPGRSELFFVAREAAAK